MKTGLMKRKPVIAVGEGIDAIGRDETQARREKDEGAGDEPPAEEPFRLGEALVLHIGGGCR